MKPGVILVALGIALLLFGAYSFAMQGGESFTAEDQYRVRCEGIVEVDTFGLGSPSLDPAPTCAVSKCTLLSGFSLSFLDAFGESGDVVLVVGGREVATQGYDSRVGENLDYALRSSCVSLPAQVSVVLYEQDSGRRVRADSYDTVISQ